MQSVIADTLSSLGGFTLVLTSGVTHERENIQIGRHLLVVVLITNEEQVARLSPTVAKKFQVNTESRPKKNNLQGGVDGRGFDFSGTEKTSYSISDGTGRGWMSAMEGPRRKTRTDWASRDYRQDRDGNDDTQIIVCPNRMLAMG
jgi:hypothetical protein